MHAVFFGCETISAPRYRSKYDDTKVDILEAVFAILQEAGQALVTGWPTLLSILQVVAECIYQ
jgi:hypothetical protein